MKTNIIFLSLLSFFLPNMVQATENSIEEREENNFYLSSVPQEVVLTEVWTHLDWIDIHNLGLTSKTSLFFLNAYAKKIFDNCLTCVPEQDRKIFAVYPGDAVIESKRFQDSTKTLGPIHSVQKKKHLAKLEEFSAAPWRILGQHRKYYADFFKDQSKKGFMKSTNIFTLNNPVMLLFLKDLTIKFNRKGLTVKIPRYNNGSNENCIEGLNFINNTFLHQLGEKITETELKYLFLESCSKLTPKALYDLILSLAKSKIELLSLMDEKYESKTSPLSEGVQDSLVVTGKSEIGYALGSGLGNTPIKFLNLDSFDLGDAGITHFAQGIKDKSISLLTLDLARNGITATGAKAFLENASENIKVQRLRLAYNPLKDNWTNLLIGKIANMGIKELELNHCHISDQSAQNLSRAFAGTVLKRIDLSYNAFTIAGLRILGTHLSGIQIKANHNNLSRPEEYQLSSELPHIFSFTI